VFSIIKFGEVVELFQSDLTVLSPTIILVMVTVLPKIMDAIKGFGFSILMLAVLIYLRGDSLHGFVHMEIISLTQYLEGRRSWFLGFSVL
jgi:hypothetical protein